MIFFSSDVAHTVGFIMDACYNSNYNSVRGWDYAAQNNFLEVSVGGV